MSCNKNAFSKKVTKKLDIYHDKICMLKRNYQTSQLRLSHVGAFLSRHEESFLSLRCLSLKVFSHPF